MNRKIGFFGFYISKFQIRNISAKKFTTSKFFLAITIILIFAIFFVNSLFTIVKVKNNLNKIDFSSLLLGILNNSPENFEKKLDFIEAEIVSSLKPITSILPLESKIKSDLSDVRSILKKWVINYQPLSQYSLTNMGFVNDRDQNKFFTDELSIFISNSESLLLETKKIWSRVSIYKDILFILPGNKLKDYIKVMDTFIVTLEKILENKNQVLSILGHFNSQKIVIFNQNIGETRPTGGFIGSYIPITITKGRVEIGESQSIYFVDNNRKDSIFAHPASWYYQYPNDAGSHDSRNSNFFPCFSTSAKLLESEFSLSNNGYSIDTLVMITPQFLQKLLPSNFTFKSMNGKLFNSSNILDEIERITSTEATTPENPKKELSAIFSNLIDKVSENMANEDKVALMARVFGSIDSRDLQFWFKDEKVESFLKESGFDSDKVCNKKSENKITPLLANISSDKHNLITENQFNIFKSSSNGEITVKYKQLLPTNPVLQRGFNEENQFSFVALQLPQDAQNLNIFSPQSLKIPFFRKYYEQEVYEKYERKMRAPETIQTILDSGKNIYSDDGSKPGFVYNQPDGSKVLGIYISDEDISEVQFSFTLPKSNQKKTVFYGQPGLNKPTLSLGNGVSFENNPDDKLINNADLIQSGLGLRFD